MDLINNFKGRKTIIIVSHNLNNLTHTDYILSLENHKIIKNNNEEKLFYYWWNWLFRCSIFSDINKKRLLKR